MAARQKVEIVITARDRTRAVFARIRRAILGLRTRLAALAAVLGLGKLAIDAAKFAQNMINAAAATGATTTQLQALVAVGRKYGVDQDQLLEIFADINMARAEVLGGNERMLESFNQLGVSWDFIKSRQNPLDYMLRFAGATERAGDNFATLSDDLGQIIGEEGVRKSMALLRTGAGGIAEAMVKALDTGLVVREEDLQSVAHATATAQELATQATSEMTEAMALATRELQSLAAAAAAAQSNRVETIAEVRGFGINEYSP